MCKKQITRFLAGVSLALALGVQGFAQSSAIRSSDACESTKSKAQASSLSDRETAARAEERVEALWTKLFDLQMEEVAPPRPKGQDLRFHWRKVLRMNLQARLDDLDYMLTPRGIQRALAFVGSVRPMDELRDGLRIRLESEKARVNKLLELLASSRERLEAAISEADAELERIRQRLIWQ